MFKMDTFMDMKLLRGFLEIQFNVPLVRLVTLNLNIRFLIDTFELKFDNGPIISRNEIWYRVSVLNKRYYYDVAIKHSSI